MTAEKSRAQVETLFDDTERTLGFRFTRQEDRPARLGCDRPDGTRGTSFSLVLRTAPPLPDVPAAMAAVQRLWQERG